MREPVELSVPRRTLAGRGSGPGCTDDGERGETVMQAAAEVQFVVDTIVEANRRGHEASLRAAGALLAPQVHLLVEQREPPYLGFVTCRPFYRGGDVTRALRGLGVAASLVGASRLVLVWEHQDLCTALEKPGAGEEPCGQVAVDAHRDGGHVLRWHPFRLHAGPASPEGWPTAVPVWGAPVLHREAVLPLAVGELLRVWRDTPVVDPRAAITQGGLPRVRLTPHL